jgi:transcription factor TFIIIB component B''
MILLEKGNTVFKPVTKARVRTGSDNRHTSSSSDVRSTSVASVSRPPPATFPRHSSSHLSSAEEAFSDTPQGHVVGSSIVVNPSPTQNKNTAASAISVPTSDSVRPPVIQSFTSASHVSTPTPPRILSGAHKGDLIPTTSPVTMQAKRCSDNQQLVSTTAPFEPTPAMSVSANIPSESVAAAISDAQIDPALLEAVVTVLQHVNQTDNRPSQPAEQQPAPLSQITAQENDNQTRPILRKRGRKSLNQGPEDVGPSNTNDVATLPRRNAGRSSRIEAEHSADEDEEGLRPNRRRRKRLSNDTSISTRPRAPSVPPFDPEADPGEEIDPTAVTMADLCDDTGRGRISSKVVQIMTNHTAWRAANREKRARMRALMDAKKYGKNTDEEENAQTQTIAEQPQQESNSQPEAGPSTDQVPPAEAAPPEGAKGDDFDYTQAMSTSRYNVQVRVGPNGETIIDEASLFVDRQEEDETANYTHVEESDTTKFVNSLSYSKKLRGSRWSTEETELFYDVSTLLMSQI